MSAIIDALAWVVIYAMFIVGVLLVAWGVLGYAVRWALKHRPKPSRN